MNTSPLPQIQPRNVIVFSGHMIDAPGRAEPRFPPAAETAVRDRLAAQLEQWDVGPADLAICGAARGGDILFAELCVTRGAHVWLFIARPDAGYLAESVRLPGSDWERRFHALAAAGNVRKFHQQDFFPRPDDGLDVHARNNVWIVETGIALARTPESLRAILVWDGKPTGDGPGGTSDFAARIRNAGGVLAPVIDPAPVK